MAQLRIADGMLVLALTRFEKAEAVHSDLSAPLAKITKVSIVENATSEIHGFRVGTGNPGVAKVGSFTTPRTKTFAVVHHDTPRALRFEIQDANYDQWIVGLADPDATLVQLRAAGLPQ